MHTSFLPATLGSLRGRSASKKHAIGASRTGSARAVAIAGAHTVRAIRVIGRRISQAW